MTTYASSDLHLGHKNILFYTIERARRWANKDVLELAEKYAKDKNRAELQEGMKDIRVSIDESVERMSSGVIDEWNSVVGQDDDVCVTGDMMMGQSKNWEGYLNRLKGNIHLVSGNHDKKFRKQQYVIDRMVWIKDYHEMRVRDPEASNGKNQLIVMQHYAPYVWNENHRGSWAICGHSHGSLDEYHRDRLSLDVGVDAENSDYKPLSYEKIRGIKQKKSINVVDHHDGKETL